MLHISKPNNENIVRIVQIDCFFFIFVRFCNLLLWFYMVDKDACLSGISICYTFILYRNLSITASQCIIFIRFIFGNLLLPEKNAN